MRAHRYQKGGAAVAMTLVEMIGVLAVIAVLAGIALPSAIRYLDRKAVERERAYLQSLAKSFQDSIVRNRVIGAPANWPALIAAESGQSVAEVAANPRNRQRAFLYDKGGWLATATLPYTQTNTSPLGLSGLPANARAMIVSSIGAPLPTDLEDANMTAAKFLELWDSGDEPPAWVGRRDDLLVQRINLAPLFANVVLSTYMSTNLGRYAIDGFGPLIAPVNAGVSAFLIKGTVIDLLSCSPLITNQSRFIVENDTSFVYENGIWRSSILAGSATGLGDISGIVEAFLAAVPNHQAENGLRNALDERVQQAMIVDYFIDFMDNYKKWEEIDNFNDSSSYKTALKVIQPQMIDACEGLFLKAGNVASDYYPSNSVWPCGPFIPP